MVADKYACIINITNIKFTPRVAMTFKDIPSTKYSIINFLKTW